MWRLERAEQILDYRKYLIIWFMRSVQSERVLTNPTSIFYSTQVFLVVALEERLRVTKNIWINHLETKSTAMPANL